MTKRNIIALIITILFVIASLAGCGSLTIYTTEPTSAPLTEADPGPGSADTTADPAVTGGSVSDPADTTSEPSDTASGSVTAGPPAVTTGEPVTSAPVTSAPATEPVTTPDVTTVPAEPLTEPSETTAEPPVTTEPSVTTAEPPVTTTEPPVTVPPHTHLYSAQYVAPTCTEKGYTLHTCSCGDSYSDNEKAALGHDWKAADCTAAKTCKRCGKTEGSALGHSYGDWVVVTEPTTATEGLREKTCGRCGDKIRETIPKIDPNSSEALEFAGTYFTVKLSGQNVRVGDTFTVTVVMNPLSAAALGVEIPEPASLTGTEFVSASWKGNTVIKTWDSENNHGSVLYEENTVSGEVMVITLRATSAGQVTLPVYACAKTRIGVDHVFRETVNAVINITG